MALKVGSRVTFHENAANEFNGTVVELTDVYVHTLTGEQLGTVKVLFDGEAYPETFQVDELEECE